MTITLKPRIGDPIQHVPKVKHHDMHTSTYNGATTIKFDHTTIADSDDAVDFEHIAQQDRVDLQIKAEQREIDNQSRFDELYPSEKRLAIEKYYTPLIQKLSAQHILECDRVAEFEDHQQQFEETIRKNWAFDGRHQDVQKRICQGDFHFNEMLRMGQLNIEGYKLVERRSNGGAIQVTSESDILSSPGGSSTLFFIPNDIPNLLHYADSDEAKQISKSEYDNALSRLISARKRAAIALTEAKQAARQALSEIPTFEELISDSVKRAVRK